MARKAAAASVQERRGPGRPVASDREESRQRIIRAAQKTFSTRGYSDATNAMIAKEAGMTSGALYHYYDSKKALFEAAAAYNWDLISEQLQNSVKPETPVGRLEGLIAMSSEIATKDPDISRFAITIATETERHEELADIGRKYRARREELLGDLVDNAIDCGEVDMDGLERRDVIALLMAVTDGLARLAASRGGLALHHGATRALNKLLEGNLFHLQSKV